MQINAWKDLKTCGIVYPPTISSLKITDRSFRYASPRLWNQLPDSFTNIVATGSGSDRSFVTVNKLSEHMSDIEYGCSIEPQ